MIILLDKNRLKIPPKRSIMTTRDQIFMKDPRILFRGKNSELRLVLRFNVLKRILSICPLTRQYKIKRNLFLL